MLIKQRWDRLIQRIVKNNKNNWFSHNHRILDNLDIYKLDNYLHWIILTMQIQVNSRDSISINPGILRTTIVLPFSLLSPMLQLQRQEPNACKLAAVISVLMIMVVVVVIKEGLISNLLRERISRRIDFKGIQAAVVGLLVLLLRYWKWKHFKSAKGHIRWRRSRRIDGWIDSSEDQKATRIWLNLMMYVVEQIELARHQAVKIKKQTWN